MCAACWTVGALAAATRTLVSAAQSQPGACTAIAALQRKPVVVRMPEAIRARTSERSGGGACRPGRPAAASGRHIARRGPLRSRCRALRCLRAQRRSARLVACALQAVAGPSPTRHDDAAPPSRRGTRFRAPGAAGRGARCVARRGGCAVRRRSAEPAFSAPRRHGAAACARPRPPAALHRLPLHGARPTRRLPGLARRLAAALLAPLNGIADVFSDASSVLQDRATGSSWDLRQLSLPLSAYVFHDEMVRSLGACEGCAGRAAVSEAAPCAGGAASHARHAGADGPGARQRARSAARG